MNCKGRILDFLSNSTIPCQCGFPLSWPLSSHPVAKSIWGLLFGSKKGFISVSNYCNSSRHRSGPCWT